MTLIYSTTEIAFSRPENPEHEDMLPLSPKGSTILVSTRMLISKPTSTSCLISPCKWEQRPFLGNKKRPKKREFRSNCREKQREGQEGEKPISLASPYEVLGVDSSSSLADIKAAFRAKVTPIRFLAYCVLGLCCLTAKLRLSLISQISQL